MNVPDDDLDELSPSQSVDDGVTPAPVQAAGDDPSGGWVCQCVCDNPGLVHR